MSGAFRVDGDAYDDFMGRYSTRLAPLFADFAGVAEGSRALDVGAGTGALTGELVARGASIAAVDPSPEFVAVLRRRFPDLEVEEAAAESLPFGDGVFDVALAQLVVAFMSDAPAAIAEMARVARRVAVCMWGIEEVEMFAAVSQAAQAIGLPLLAEPLRYRTAQEIRELLEPHGEVATGELDVATGYRISTSSGSRSPGASVRSGNGSRRSTRPRASAHARRCSARWAAPRARSSSVRAPSPRRLRPDEHRGALGPRPD